LRVLVAEDTYANQKLLTTVLAKRGHVVESARDGHEAVELAGDRQFDVILMDVQMPRMDGLQATSAIRGMPDPHRRRVPIIALTAHAMEGDRERFLEAGMDGYFTKPIHAPRLIEYLESRYSAAASNGLEWNSPPAPDAPHSVAAATPNVSSLEGLDE
jgi:CheY-like chemotaxis protein